MIVLDIPQGSLEWLSARAGIPSSSNFDKIVTTTGAPSKQAEKYLLSLAVERVTGKAEESYKNANMERGNEMESEARNFYELTEGVDVKQVGLCFPDERKLYACSPDGLVGEDGLLEIKCPISSTAASYLLGSESLEMAYLQQCQGQMLVTGRKWVDLLSYFPGLRPAMVRIERDKEFLFKLETELMLFVDRLKQVTEKIR